jgi:nucleoside 2-deoxyribosyltransferase
MPDEFGRPFVYLAGPDVFQADAIARGEQFKAALLARGMVGLFPLDAPVNPPDPGDGKALGLAIAEACEASMLRADMAIANIEPWRGPEADDGTSYEIGFMAALGKPIVLYSRDRRSFFDRIVFDVYGGEIYRDDTCVRGKRDDCMIEGFNGFADNVMLINAAAKTMRIMLGPSLDPAQIVQPDFESAADLAKSIWEKQEQTR